MNFHIEKHSAIPAAKQIEEQIKLAVMMGIFRNGDTLPSIREIEKQTGVNRSQIHKAYQGLRNSGLLVLTRGKGSVITTATDYPQSFSEDCRKMSEQTLLKARRLGISPTAFARYFSRYAQESELESPFIIYVDASEEIAIQQAAEISQLWRVPVAGREYKALSALKGKNTSRHRILVNHVMCEEVRSLIGSKSSVIPIEVRYSRETIDRLSRIKPNSSLKLLVLPHPSHRIQFMKAQTLNLILASGVEITAVTIRSPRAMAKVLREKKYDYCVLGPALRGSIPAELRNDPHIIPMDPKLDPASLEIARIRAGVII